MTGHVYARAAALRRGMGPASVVRLSGYGVVNIGARYRLRPVEASVRINNLLNHKYYTSAQLGASPFDNNGNVVARPFPPVDGAYPIRSSTFFAPGSPIDVFSGLKFRF